MKTIFGKQLHQGAILHTCAHSPCRCFLNFKTKDKQAQCSGFSQLIGKLVALQMTVFLSTIVVMGPASVLPPSADTVAPIIRHGAVQSSLMPTSLIEDFCADPSSLELIQKQMKYIDFAGALLPKRVGHLLGP